MNRRAAAVVLAAACLVLVGCGGEEQDAKDPFVRCVDVSVDYGIAEDRADAANLCEWIGEHEGLLGGASFEETFSSDEAAAEWAKAELAKD